MRSSLIFTAAISALIVAAVAVHADPVKTTNKTVTPPVAMKPKAMAAASSSSSSSSADKGKSGSASAANAKSDVPDYQTALEALNEAKLMATLDPNASQAAGSGVKTINNAEAPVINTASAEKAVTAIGKAIDEVKQAAMADRVTVNADAPPKGGVPGTLTAPEQRLSEAQTALGKAMSITDVKPQATINAASRTDMTNAHKDISDAQQDVKIAMDIRPNYNEVNAYLEKAKDALDKIKDTDWPSTGTGKDKQTAEADIKTAETSVTSIMKTEHISAVAASGLNVGEMSGKSRTDPLGGGVTLDNFTSVHDTLDHALLQLKKGDTDQAVQTDLRSATTGVDEAMGLVKTAEDAGKKNGKTGSGSSSSSK